MNSRRLITLGAPVLIVLLVCCLVLFSNPDLGGPSENRPAGEAQQGQGLAVAGDETADGVLAAQAGRSAIPERQSLSDTDEAYRAALSGFAGRIVDDGRRPLPDRVVRFYRIDAEIIQNLGLFTGGDEEVGVDVQIHEGRTDAEGRFLVTGVWPRAMYMLEADPEGDNRLTLPVDKTPATGEIVDLGDILLPSLGVIVGRVVDENGKAVPGAMVRAADIPGVYLDLAPVERFDPEGGMMVREGNEPRLVVEVPAFVKRYFDMLSRPMTTTGAKGEFRLGGVQPKKNVVVVNKRNLLPLIEKDVEVKAGKVEDVGTLEMREGEEAYVKVVDSDDEPIAGAEIMLGAMTPMIPVDFLSRVGVTDAEGQLSVTGIPRGRVSVAARRSSGHPWVMAKPVSVDADVVIRLPGRYHFDLTLVSSAGQKIVNPEFKLLPSPDKGMPLDVGAMGFIKWLDIDDNVKPLEDGRYRIGELIPGKYTLAVTAERHAAGKISFEIVKSAEGEISLPPESTFVVRVVDGLDEPINRAKIYLRTHRPDSGTNIMEMPIVAGETDKDGTLVIRDAQAGTIRLSASHPAYGYSHGECKLPTADVVVLRMDGPGHLSGVLTEHGKRPTPGKWTVVIEPRFRGFRGAMVEMPKFTVPDLDGNFAAEGLQPGRYRLRVMESIRVLTSPGGFVGFAMRARLMRNNPRKDVVVESGQSTFVRMEAVKQAEVVDGPSARVSGTIMVNGRPGSGLLVSGRGKRRHGVAADDAGRFDLGSIPVGTLRLSVRDPARAEIADMRMESHMWRDTVRIEDGKDVVLDIQISMGSISGFVRTAAGAPAKMVRVKAVGRHKDSLTSRTMSSTVVGMTDTSGRFRLDAVPGGAYEIEARDRTQGFGKVTGVEVQPGGAIAGVAIQLDQVHTVSGRVNLDVFAEDRPRWCYLVLTRTTNSGVSHAGVRRGGAFYARGLPPGTYTVKVMIPGDGGPARPIPIQETITVQDQDIKNVTLTPRPGVDGGARETSPGRKQR